MTSHRLILLPAVWLVMSAVFGDAASIRPISVAYETGKFSRPRFWFTPSKYPGPKTLEFPPQDDDIIGKGILLLQADGTKLKVSYARKRVPKEYRDLLQIRVQRSQGSPIRPYAGMGKIMYDETKFGVQYPLRPGRHYVNIRAKNRADIDFRLYMTPLFDFSVLFLKSGTFGKWPFYKFNPSNDLNPFIYVTPKDTDIEYAPNILLLEFSKVDSGILVLNHLPAGIIPLKHKDLLYFRSTKGGVELFKPKGRQPFNKIIYDTSVFDVRPSMFGADYVDITCKAKSMSGQGFRLYKSKPHDYLPTVGWA